MANTKSESSQTHTLCGENGEYCPIYGIKCGSDIERCPVYRTFRIIGRKWALQILQEFFVNNGVRRFNEIQKSLKWITPRVMSKRLKEMEDEELITRRVFSDKSPIRVEYTLTDKGRGLEGVIQTAIKWGKEWEIVGVTEANRI